MHSLSDRGARHVDQTAWSATSKAGVIWRVGGPDCTEFGVMERVGAFIASFRRSCSASSPSSFFKTLPTKLYNPIEAGWLFKIVPRYISRVIGVISTGELGSESVSSRSQAMSLILFSIFLIFGTVLSRTILRAFLINLFFPRTVVGSLLFSWIFVRRNIAMNGKTRAVTGWTACVNSTLISHHSADL